MPKPREHSLIPIIAKFNISSLYPIQVTRHSITSRNWFDILESIKQVIYRVLVT